MWELRVCAVCLATDVRMYSMNVANLLQSYRLLTTGIELQKAGSPQMLCWECAALVRKFNKFRLKCERASLLLKDMYDQHGEVSEEEVLTIDRKQNNLTSSYTICPIQIDNLEFFILDSKSQESEINEKTDDSETSTLNENETGVAPMDFVQVEMDIKKEDDIVISEVTPESNDTQAIDDVFAAEDCSQSHSDQFESPIKRKRGRKRKLDFNPTQKTEIKAKVLADIGMKEEVLTQGTSRTVYQFSSNYKSESENDTEEIETKRKKKPPVLRDWCKTREFASHEEADEYLLSAGNWKKCLSYKTNDGVKVKYRCTYGEYRKNECSKGLYLLYQADSLKVSMFETPNDHDNHVDLSRGLTQQTRDMVRQLFEDGIRKPNAIIAEMRSRKLEEPVKSKLKSFLVSLRKEKLGPSFTC